MYYINRFLLLPFYSVEASDFVFLFGVEGLDDFSIFFMRCAKVVAVKDGFARRACCTTCLIIYLDGWATVI